MDLLALPLPGVPVPPPVPCGPAPPPSFAAHTSVAASPLRQLFDVSPVCIRRALPPVPPAWRHCPKLDVDAVVVEDEADEDDLEDALYLMSEARVEAENTKGAAILQKHLQSSGLKGATAKEFDRKQKLQADAHVLANRVKGISKKQKSLFKMAGNSSVVGGRAAVDSNDLVEVSHAEGTLLTIRAERNSRGESGFHIWPDFMTICTIDASRPELKSMQEGDIVIAIDGVRVSCIEDYTRLAKDIFALNLTLLRCVEPYLGIASDPCLQCGNATFMPGSLFCPECGTRRPELLLSALWSC